MASLLPDLWGQNGKRPAPFEHLHDEIDRVFDQFRRNVDLPALFTSGSDDASATLRPRIEVSETDKEVLNSAELPGVDEKDVDVTVLDNTLIIKAEKKTERTEKDNGTRFVSERTYGMFQRSIPLGFDVDPKKVDAKLSNGVLKITLPKPPEVEARKKKIEIRSGA